MRKRSRARWFSSWSEKKTVAEGAAAAAVAAAVQGTIPGIADCNVVMLLSGGNIDVNLLSRIIERGLIKDGRLAQLSVRIKDRSGALASLTTLLGSHGANILRLDHGRGTDNVWVTEADVALTLEMRGRTHVEDLVAVLQDKGYSLRQD
jgi:threonine dehydratase